jgi:hypothetical protein
VCAGGSRWSVRAGTVLGGGAEQAWRAQGQSAGWSRRSAGATRGQRWSKSRSVCRQRVRGGAATREGAADGGVGVWTREWLAVQARSAGAGGAAASVAVCE